MPKIRGVKPEFWTDDDIVELTAHARLLYIGLWNFACDNGHVEDRPRQVKMRILPADDVSVDELLDELTSCARVERSEGWITIPNLATHQRIDRRYFTTCSKPGCDAPEVDRSRNTKPKPKPHVGHTTGARREHDVSTSGTRVDGDGDGDGDTYGADKPPRTGSATQLLIGEWISSVPNRPPSSVIGQVSKQIASLARDGIDQKHIRAGLIQWSAKGLHPSTLPSVVNEVMNKPAQLALPTSGASRPSTTDQRVMDGMSVVERLREKEAGHAPQ